MMIWTKKLSEEVKNLILEIFLGYLIFNTIAAGAAALFYPRTSVFLGLFTGMLLMGIMMLHMAYTIESVVESGSSMKVAKKLSIAAAIRKFVFIGIFLIILFNFSDYINPIALVISCLGLKAGIYLRSGAAKILKHNSISGGEI